MCWAFTQVTSCHPHSNSTRQVLTLQVALLSSGLGLWPVRLQNVHHAMPEGLDMGVRWEGMRPVKTGRGGEMRLC